MKLKHFSIAAPLTFLLAACGGPSSSDVELALNNNIEQVKAVTELTSGGRDICPQDKDSLQRNPMLAQTCVLIHSKFEIDSVSNCIEKGESKFACKFEGKIVSDRYGTSEASSDGTFEESPSGWVAL